MDTLSRTLARRGRRRLVEPVLALQKKAPRIDPEVFDYQIGSPEDTSYASGYQKHAPRYVRQPSWRTSHQQTKAEIALTRLTPSLPLSKSLTIRTMSSPETHSPRLALARRRSIKIHYLCRPGDPGSRKRSGTGVLHQKRFSPAAGSTAIPDGANAVTPAHVKAADANDPNR